MFWYFFVIFYFLWHVEKRFLRSPMITVLQHTHCIVTTCQLVNLLWEQCFNPVLVQDWQQRHQCNVAMLIWNIWHLWNDLTYWSQYIDLSAVCKLAFPIRVGNHHFEFFSLDAEALRSVALSFWLPIFSRSLQSILFGSVDTGIRKWLVHTTS